MPTILPAVSTMDFSVGFKYRRVQARDCLEKVLPVKDKRKSHRSFLDLCLTFAISLYSSDDFSRCIYIVIAISSYRA